MQPKLFPLTCAAGLVLSTASLRSQTLPVRIGDRARITAPSLASSPLIATVADERLDHVLLRLTGGETVVVPYTSITRLEVSRGVHPHMLKGAVAGAVGGAVVGGVVGARSDDKGSLALGRGGLVAVGAAMGSAGGVVLGAAVGALIRSERWRDVPISPPAPLASSNAVALGPGMNRPIGAVRVPVAWLGH